MYAFRAAGYTPCLPPPVAAFLFGSSLSLAPTGLREKTLRAFFQIGSAVVYFICSMANMEVTSDSAMRPMMVL